MFEQNRIMHRNICLLNVFILVENEVYKRFW